MKITICDGIPDLLAVQCVAAVVQQGKISKDRNGKEYYCWATKIPTYKCTIIVETIPNRKGDCFRVRIDPESLKDRVSKQNP